MPPGPSDGAVGKQIRAADDVPTSIVKEVDELIAPVKPPSSSSKVVNTPETIRSKPVKPENVVDEWDRFLGPGPHSNVHPRTGAVDPDRIVSADGKRSIRYGGHETNGKPTKHHYHEETWTYDAATDTMTVDNCLIRAPYAK